MRYTGLLFLLSAASALGGENMTKPTYDPPFIISAWCGPEGNLERYKEYAECGFNLVLGGDAALAKAVGIKAIVGGGPADVPKYADDPTVVGIFLSDEPQTARFAELGELCRAIREANPRYIPYINLLPTYASPEQLGSPTYEEHVRKYIETCKPPFVSWDHYALYGSCERPDYFENLEIVCRQCRAARIPFVQIILSVPHFAYRDPDEADLRWQVYTTLAYGAKGIIYFTYVTPTDGGWYRNAIITEKGERSDKYEYVRRLNRKLNVLAPLLIGLDGVRVAHTAPLPAGGSGFDDNFPAAGADGMPMTIGWLRDGDKRDYLWVVNRSFDYHRGLIRNWEVRGPFTIPGKSAEELMDTPFAPETPEDAARSWPTAGVRASGVADLLSLREAPEKCVGYFRTRVKVPGRQNAVLDLGITTGTKAWLNGKLVLTVAGPVKQEAKVKVVLKAGWNTLLLKLTRQGDMGVSARFTKPGGALLDEVVVERELIPPADRADGTVTLREGVKNVVEISQETAKPGKAAFDAAAGRLAVLLQPGEGKLFRLEYAGSARTARPTTAPDRRKSPAGASPDLLLDHNTGVVLETDRNGLPAGTELFSTTSCLDYSLHPLVDGIRDRKELGWQGCSWASMEDPSTHGIEIRLGKPMKGGCLQIAWAFDKYNAEGKHCYVSRDYCIQVKNEAGDAWKTVADVKGNQSQVSSHPLPGKPFGFLRIYQLPGGGDPSRPNIMWVGQIELTDGQNM